MENKRGQGLSITSIILIVLGIAVLVMLIVGFTVGWSSINPFLKTNNVDTLKTACSAACATSSQYDYCSLQRELKIEQQVGAFKDGEKYTCGVLSKEASFGISCSSIPCPELKKCTSTEIGGTLRDAKCEDGETGISASDAVSGKVCCK